MGFLLSSLPPQGMHACSLSHNKSTLKDIYQIKIFQEVLLSKWIVPLSPEAHLPLNGVLQKFHEKNGARWNIRNSRWVVSRACLAVWSFWSSSLHSTTIRQRGPPSDPPLPPRPCSSAPWEAKGNGDQAPCLSTTSVTFLGSVAGV